jgi:hypothetical protein
MKTIVIFRRESEHGRAVEEYMEDFLRRTGRELEVLDPDTPDAASMCRTYDIVEYPSIIALSDDGRLQNSWRGLPLPTISELSYYA